MDKVPKTWLKIAIVLFILWSAGLFFSGYFTGQRYKECPRDIIIPHAIIKPDQQEINRLHRQILRLEAEAGYYEKGRDSLQTILNKKNEIKIINVDTAVNSIILKWARYQKTE